MAEMQKKQIYALKRQVLINLELEIESEIEVTPENALQISMQGGQFKALSKALDGLNKWSDKNHRLVTSMRFINDHEDVEIELSEVIG